MNSIISQEAATSNVQHYVRSLKVVHQPILFTNFWLQHSYWKLFNLRLIFWLHRCNMLHVILSLRADQTFRSLVVFKSLGRFLQHLSRFYLGNHMSVHRFIEDELLRAWSWIFTVFYLRWFWRSSHNLRWLDDSSITYHVYFVLIYWNPAL